MYQKSQILASLPAKPENFEQNYGFFKQLILLDKTQCLNDEIDGRLWIRELFLSYQTSTNPQKIFITVPLLSLVFTGSCLIPVIIFEY